MTGKTLTTEKKDLPGWKNPWVRAGIGLALVVVTVNISFIIVSSRTNPGLVTEEYYKYGMQQNKLDKMHRNQVKRGWQVGLSLPAKIEPGKAFNFQVKALDKQGRPITGGRMELTCYRPSDASQDISIAVNEISHGDYAASVTLPAIGIWDVNLLFESGGEKHIVRRRIHVGRESESASKRTMLDTIVNWLTD